MRIPKLIKALVFLSLFVVFFAVSACRSGTNGELQSSVDSKNTDQKAPSDSDEQAMAPDIDEPTFPEYTDALEDKHLSYTEIVERMTDPRYLSSKPIGEVSREFTSYNRSSKYENGQYVNWNANGDGGAYLRKTSDGGYLIAEIQGAGYISRIWSATASEGIIKIFVDGKEVISTPFKNLFNCSQFNYENLCYIAAKGHNCYVPISFSKSCEVVLYGDWGKYYIVNYTLFPEGYTVEPFTKEISEENAESLSRVNAFFGDKSGESPYNVPDTTFEKATVTKSSPYTKTVSGSGAIAGFLVKIPSLTRNNSKEAIDTLRSLKLSITWDNAENPSVELPLGNFFGSAYGIVDSRTLMIGVRQDKTLYNYYYMPFSDGAKIEISALSDITVDIEVSVCIDKNAKVDPDTLRFCAIFERGEYNERADRHPDYLFLKANGTGRLVGLNLHLYKNSDETDPNSNPGHAWWGEGDEKMFVDGEAFPSRYGTGTEDFFGYAWCSPILYSKAYHAQPYAVGGSKGQGNRVETRLFLNDNIPFNTQFEGYLEKYYSDEYVKYGFTVFFYLADGGSFERDTHSLYYYTDYFEYDDGAVAKNFTEINAMLVKNADGDGEYSDQQSTSYNWSKNIQLFWKNNAPDNCIELTLPAESDGEYMILAAFTSAKDYGKYSWSVNGSAFSDSKDFYNPSVIAKDITELGYATLKQGFDNTLIFRCTGKNDKATNYFFGIDFILLVPRASYTGLENTDLSPYTDILKENVKLPEIKNFILEGENYTSATINGGSVSSQSMTQYQGKWSKDRQLFWKAAAKDNTLSFNFRSTGGKYRAKAAFTVARDYGIVEVYINGVKYGTFDLYNESAVSRTEVDLGEVELATGENNIVLKVIGKNEKSTKYYVGLDCIEFTK